VTHTLVLLIDHAARLLWIAGLQFTIFGTALLVALWLTRRRPAGRQFLASVALIAASMSPLTAAFSNRSGWNCMPAPAWLLLVDGPADPGAVSTRSEPVAQLLAPPRVVCRLLF
jgi:hypothetical protein